MNSGHEPTDQDLVDAANLGEPSAMETLYERHRDWVFSHARRICRNEDDALDVLQETFTYLFGKFPGFNLTARMTTFLYPAVRNLSLERIRKRGRTVPLDEDAVEAPADEAPDPADERASLQEMLTRLPEGQAEVVSLRYGDGLSLQEISDISGVPLGTVKSRLHHALNRLRSSLDRENFNAD